MRLADFFTIKTRKQREEEQRQYDAWAFPHGPQQRKAIQELLSELLPEEDKKTGLVLFLIGREAYLGGVGEDVSGYTQDQRLQYAAKLLRDQLPGKHKKKLWRYLALVLADAEVDSAICYPTAQQLLQKAAELEAQG